MTIAFSPRLPIPARATWGSAFLAIGFGSLAAPVLFGLARKHWSTEQGEQGPIVLAIGVWLLFRIWPSLRADARPSPPLTAAVILAPASILYVFATLADQLLPAALALYLLLVGALVSRFGLAALWRRAFPLIFLAASIPAPFALMYPLTAHLRLWISLLVTLLLRDLDFNIVRDGLNLYIDQYGIVIAEACSGLNSLISLSALGLVYIYVRRNPSWTYYLLMLTPIIAFAVFGNFSRVLAVVLFTHAFGDGFTQTYLHEAAGLVTFCTALLGVVVIDAVLGRSAERARR